VRRAKPEPIHEVFFATNNASRETGRKVDELRALQVRCFDGGGLGFFLGNTLGDEDTKVGRTKINEKRDSKKSLNILVFGFLLLLVFQFTLLLGEQVTTTLETERCNQSLNLRTRGHLVVA
jgi:hypothetical protein